jgi:glycosyltransferase involved in cell wall biosynthesis
LIKILHVVENFNGQAVESWLTRVLEYEGYDSSRWHFDFFLLGSGLGKYAGPMRQKGSSLYQGNPGGASLPQMARGLRYVVKRGDYSIVHIHQDVMAGVFGVALAGTRVRIITHVHNCWQRLPVGGVLKARMLTEVARRIALLRSDAIVGVSRQALMTMTRGAIRQGRADRVIYCSVKLSNGDARTDEEGICGIEVRTRFSLPDSAKILLFLGRLDDYKNPDFALRILARLLEEGERDVYLLVAGVGGLAEELRQSAIEKGIDAHLRLIGWLEDPAPMLMAANLLLMPSAEHIGEGLGLAAVEAQSYGLPVLASMSVPEDAAIVPGLFQRLSLKEGCAGWAALAKRLFAQGRGDVVESKKRVAASAFTDAASYTALVALYEELVQINGMNKRPIR